MMLAVAVIVNSGPKIKNRCTDIPEMRPVAAAIVKLTPSNQESLQCYRAGKYNGPPAQFFPQR